MESLLLVRGPDWAENLLWGAPKWMAPAAVIAAALLLLIGWNYAARGMDASIRVLAAGLKVLAVLMIAICLLEPMRSGTRPRPRANVLPILVDNSQSMQLKSTSATVGRGARVAELVAEETPWRIRLAQAFDVRSYTFDSRLENVADFSELTMEGHVSSLSGSLRALGERLEGRPVGGVILFTDGNWTDPPANDFDWATLGFPVFPVIPRSDDEVRDLRITDVSVSQTDFESAPVLVRVTFDAVAIPNQKVFVRLSDATSGKVIEESAFDWGTSDRPKEVRFRFRPEETGTTFYNVAVFTAADREAFSGGRQADADAVSAEATLANNRRVVAVNRSTGPYRILYVAGRPNWEYKFLRRSLAEDAEVQMVALLRIAKEEPKFSFRDRGVSGTNPLFAGLGSTEEDAAQQYDEPVILRLGVKESEELSEGFPESAEELFAYQGIILDDLEPEFFTQDQMLLLRRFVGTRGGGLLMLGGQESFAQRGFAETPLGELSAVYARRGGADAGAEGARLELTREGVLQPWMRLRDNETDERQRLAAMPPFLTVNRVGEVKPGATALAVVKTDEGATLPAIVTQRFGKGRSAAIMLGDLWRWSMRRDEAHPDDSGQAWRQLAHWLVNEVPKRAEVNVEPAADPNRPVKIEVAARDEAYLPLDNAKVQLQITPLGGEPFEVQAEADPDRAGWYLAEHWSRQPGGYRVQATVTAADGSHVGRADAGWAIQTGAAEFGDLSLNRRLLQTIAKETGGEVIDDDALESFAASLPDRKVPVTESWVYPIWHQPWVMLIAMVCLCGEWGLRRWKGWA